MMRSRARRPSRRSAGHGRGRIPPALLAAATLFLLGARCEASVGNELNTDRLESEIQTGIEEQNPGITIESVDCPDDVPLEQGHTFTCTARDDAGNTATVDVEQTDDQGNVRWELN